MNKLEKLTNPALLCCTDEIIQDGILAEALEIPEWAAKFLVLESSLVPDKDKAIEVACQSPEWAYFLALKYTRNPDIIKKCQDAACSKNPWYAYRFALNVPGADIKKCYDVVAKCNDTKLIRCFYNDVDLTNVAE